MILILEGDNSMKRNRFRNGNEISARGNIVIWEKIDGVNASFQREGDKFQCFFRSSNLDESKDKKLGGFYGWVQENISAKELVKGYVFFDEWTDRHKIDYDKNFKKFYFFDNYKSGAEHLGLTLAPILYEGEYISEDHIQSFIGKTMLAPDCVGKGVVVKNYSYFDKHGNPQRLSLKCSKNKWC